MNPTAADDVRSRDEVGPPAPFRTSRRRLLWIVLAVVFAPVVVASLWPVTYNSREELFDIPKGTWARHMAGDKHDLLPPEIDLLIGVHNVLKLKNSDVVPQIVGPTLLMPGQSLSIPFTRPSENYFNCTAHASGQLLIKVEKPPVWPWERLAWRVRRMLQSVSAT